MIKKIKEALNFTKSLRKKLIFTFLLAILIPSFMLSLYGIYAIKKSVYKEAQSKINSDHEYAKEVFYSYKTKIDDTIRIHATRKVLYLSLSNVKQEELSEEMDKILREENLDFLTLIDKDGKVFYSATNKGFIDYSYKENPFVSYVFNNMKPISGFAIIPSAELKVESEELEKRAYMEITETLKSRKISNKYLKDGLIVGGAAPVFRLQKQFVGVLYGGILINRNYEIVDKIRNTISDPKWAMYDGKPTLTVTIFQEDVRISTNVLNEDGTRAISTKVSEEVASTVLDKQEVFKGRAFVVTDWYISVYSPIKDIANKTIGILYVGILEKPYRDNLIINLKMFLTIALVSIVSVGFLSFRVADGIAKVVTKLSSAAEQLGGGNYDVKVEIPKRNDELFKLTENFNIMVNELRETHLALKSWALVLEEKVEERTKILKNMQEQLVHTEKMAAIGRLAAGVAHEINNPLTGILTNANLLYEDLNDNDERKTDLKVIIEETLRCRNIVKGLLDFARQSPPLKQLVSVNKLIEDVITLVRNQANFRNIKIVLDLDNDIPQIMADKDQISQVILNIVLNAADAMPNGGELKIVSKVGSNGYIHLSFSDTGSGIDPLIKDKLFEPFVTTKKNGTGLGLSIAYGIIERHSGKITVESIPKKGTTFRIILPWGKR